MTFRRANNLSHIDLQHYPAAVVGTSAYTLRLSNPPNEGGCGLKSAIFSPAITETSSATGFSEQG